MTSSETETDVAALPESAESEPAVRMDIAVAISDAGPCKKHLKITIPRAEIDRQVDGSLVRLRKEAVIPGFRPGRAPKQLFMKRFRKELAEEVKTTLLTNSLKQIDEDYKLEPMAQPKLDVGAIEIPDEGPMDFEMDVEVRPQFETPNYKSLTVRRPRIQFTEADVDMQVARFLSRRGQIVPKLEGAAEIGDQATADVAFLAGDGRVLSEHSELQFRVPAELRFQDGGAPTFGAVMTGATVGETRDVPGMLGTSAAEPELRSVPITLRVHLKDLKHVRPPVATDEYMRELGFENLEDLRAAVKKMLERRAEAEAWREMRRQIMDALLKATPFDLPIDLVSREERNTVARLVAELRQEGMTDQDIRARSAQIRANAHESTMRTFKEFLLLVKLAEAEGVSITDDDVDLEIEAIAQRTDESPRRVRARMEKDKSFDTLADKILDRRVVDRILGYSNIEDYTVAQTSLDEDVETLDQSAVPPAPVEAEAAEQA